MRWRSPILASVSNRDACDSVKMATTSRSMLTMTTVLRVMVSPVTMRSVTV